MCGLAFKERLLLAAQVTVSANISGLQDGIVQYRSVILGKCNEFLCSCYNADDNWVSNLEVGMYRQGVHLISVLLIIASLTLVAISQTSQPPAQSQATKDSSSQPLATFQSSTRMVTLEVVARDHRGQHASGLTATDFRVLEQSPSRGKTR